MSDYTVERDWITAAGLRAVVTMGSMGHRCGYVAVPAGHLLHGVDYSERCAALPSAENEPMGKRSILGMLTASDRNFQSPDCAFDVHGGLTYSGGSDYPVASDGLWWFGYDCGHCDDAASPEYLDVQRAKYPDQPYMYRDHGVHRSHDYCVDECEGLARQIVAKTAVVTA